MPSSDWSSALRWAEGGNADEMLKIVDPLGNYAFEVHQYLDRDGSGKSSGAVKGLGSTVLISATQWARRHGQRMFLGEFAWGRDSIDGAREGDDMLSYMWSNTDVWVGWAYWGGGSQWGNYEFSLNLARPSSQMNVLSRYLSADFADANR